MTHSALGCVLTACVDVRASGVCQPGGVWHLSNVCCESWLRLVLYPQLMLATPLSARLVRSICKLHCVSLLHKARTRAEQFAQGRA